MVKLATGDCRAITIPTSPDRKARVRFVLQCRPRAESDHCARRYQRAAATATTRTTTANGLNSHRVSAVWELREARAIPFISGIGPDYRSSGRSPIR